MSKQIDDGGPAFPSQWDDKDNEGMSLRAWCAGQALSGILAGYWANPEMSGLTAADYAEESCAAADALIAALKGGAA